MASKLWQNEDTTQHSERSKQTMSEGIVQLNEEIIKGQLKELVRGSVEEALNSLLEAEEDQRPEQGATSEMRRVKGTVADIMIGAWPRVREK